MKKVLFFGVLTFAFLFVASSGVINAGLLKSPILFFNNLGEKYMESGSELDDGFHTGVIDPDTGEEVVIDVPTYSNSPLSDLINWLKEKLFG